MEVASSRYVTSQAQNVSRLGRHPLNSGSLSELSTLTRIVLEERNCERVVSADCFQTSVPLACTYTVNFTVFNFTQHEAGKHRSTAVRHSWMIKLVPGVRAKFSHCVHDNLLTSPVLNRLTV